MINDTSIVHYAITTVSINATPIVLFPMSLLLGMLTFLVASCCLAQLVNKMVYEVIVTRERIVEKPIMKPKYKKVQVYRKEPVMSTREAVRKKPIYGTRTAYEERPVYATRTAYRTEPAYKTVTKSKPKYRKETRTRSVCKPVTRTEWYYDTETEYVNVPYQKEHWSYYYSPNGNNYYTTEYRLEPRTKSVHKSRTVNDTEWVTETYEEDVRDGDEEWTEQVRDGTKQVPYEESYVSRYEKIPYEEQYVTGYTDETYMESYISGYTDVAHFEDQYDGERQAGTKMVAETYNETEQRGVSKLVADEWLGFVSYVLFGHVLFSVLAAQIASFAFQIYSIVCFVSTNMTIIMAGVIMVNACVAVVCIIILVYTNTKRKEAKIVCLVMRYGFNRYIKQICSTHETAVIVIHELKGYKPKSNRTKEIRSVTCWIDWKTILEHVSEWLGIDEKDEQERFGEESMSLSCSIC